MSGASRRCLWCDTSSPRSHSADCCHSLCGLATGPLCLAWGREKWSVASYPGRQGQPDCAPCVGPLPVTLSLVTGYLIRPAETWPTVHSTPCPLPPRSPSVYRNLRMLRSEPGPVPADKGRVSLAVVISNQLTALVYLSVADTTLPERLRPLSQSPDVQDSSQSPGSMF